MLAGELAQALTYWRERLVARVEGMTDAEYLWEPVDGCWTVRPRADGTWRADVGPEGFTWTPVVPPPFTTIAWRMWHLGASPDPTWPATSCPTPRAFAEAWFSPRRQDEAPSIASAGDAIEALRRHWAAFAAMVGGFEDAALLEPIGPIGGPFAEASVHALVVHVADELIHHGAEIGVLRDLAFRARPVGGTFGPPGS